MNIIIWLFYSILVLIVKIGNHKYYSWSKLVTVILRVIYNGQLGLILEQPDHGK